MSCKEITCIGFANMLYFGHMDPFRDVNEELSPEAKALCDAQPLNQLQVLFGSRTAQEGNEADDV